MKVLRKRKLGVVPLTVLAVFGGVLCSRAEEPTTNMVEELAWKALRADWNTAAEVKQQFQGMMRNAEDPEVRLAAAEHYALLCASSFGPSAEQAAGKETKEIHRILRMRDLEAMWEATTRTLPILDALGDTERESASALSLAYHLALNMTELVRKARPLAKVDGLTSKSVISASPMTAKSLVCVVGLTTRTVCVDGLVGRPVALLESILDAPGDPALDSIKEKASRSIVYKCQVRDDSLSLGWESGIRRLLEKYPGNEAIQTIGDRELRDINRIRVRNLNARLK